MRSRLALAVAAATASAWGCTASDAGPGPSELEVPATVSVVSVADVNPAWPIGAWSTDGTTVVIRCDDGTSHSDSQRSSFAVAAGAGLDFKVTTDSGYPYPFCDWAGTPSSDGRAVVGAPTWCTYATQGGFNADMNLEAVSLQIAGEDLSAHKRNAYFYASGTLRGAFTTTCRFALEDFRVSRFPSETSAVAGHHDEALATPVPLLGWGLLPAGGAGQDVDVAAFRRTLALDIDGTPRPGLTFDVAGYAMKQDVTRPDFDVLVAMSNTSAEPFCFGGAAIQSVTNAAGLPVTADQLLPIVDAPVVGDATCLRPGDRAWLRSFVLAADEAAFQNTARLRVSAPSTTLLGGTRKTIATPFRARQLPGHGLEIDFVGDPFGASAIFLDDAGAPVGFVLSRDVFPSGVVRPEVATVTLPPHAALGHPAKVAVFPSSSSF